jgi:hypothetical protein
MVNVMQVLRQSILYVEVCDAGTQAVNTFTSIQGQGLRTPQQSVTDHSHAMGQDGARQGTLPLYLNNRGSQVKVWDKAAVHIGHHRNLAAKQSRSHKAPTPKTFSSIVQLIANNPPEQAQTQWKPLTDLSELTISSLDPLVI